MRIDPNFDRVPVTGTQSAPVAAKRTTGSAGAGVSQSSELLKSVKDLPVVRADRVARARELLSDPNYPSDEVLGRVAGRLAEGI
jgi:hypothetical protein